MPAPDVWITPVKPAGPTVAFGLADTGTVTQSSGTIWTAVARPRRKAFLEYTADALAQLDLPLILDGADNGSSIEHSVALVNGWRRPTSGTGEPPILAVTGPIDQAGVRSWACQTVAFGSNQQRRRDGALVQTDLKLTLLEFSSGTAAPQSPTQAAQVSAVLGLLAQTGVQVPANLTALVNQLPSILSTTPPALASAVTTQIAAFLVSIPNNTAGSQQVVSVALPQLAQILPSLGGGRVYVVRQGETLSRIAARELGDYRKVFLIAALNGIRDPNYIQVNQRLLLP